MKTCQKPYKFDFEVKVQGRIWIMNVRDLLRGVDRCHHISFVTPERVWSNDGKNIILADTTIGETLYCLLIFPKRSCLG